MDVLTHGLIGVSLSQLADKLGFVVPTETKEIVFLVGIIASLTPDLDFLPAFFSKRLAWQYHRKVFHSLFAVVPLAALSVLLSYFCAQGLSFLPLEQDALFWAQMFFFAAGAILFHLFFDFLTSFGVAFLYPFSSRMYCGSLLYLSDPGLLFIFLIGAGLSEPVYTWLAVGVYLLIVLGTKALAKRRLLCDLKKHSDDPCVNDLFPRPLRFWAWCMVVEFDQTYLLGYSKIGGRPLWYETKRGNVSRDISKAKSEPTLGAFLEIARFPRIEERTRNGVRYWILDDVRWWAETRYRIMTFTAELHASGSIESIRESGKLWRGPFVEFEPLPLDVIR